MLRISVVLLLVACATVGRGYEIIVDVDDKDVKEAADKTVYDMNKSSSTQFYYKLVKISAANKWTDFGDIYSTLIVGETTCKKQEVTYEEAKQCDIKEGANAYKKCSAHYSLKDKSGDHVKYCTCKLIPKSEI